MTFIDVKGVHTYYEVHGEGDPLVLLHGGGDSGAGFGSQIPALAEHYRVIVPDRRGHGRTPDVEGPLTYPGMTEDTIAFLTAIDVAKAHLVGWSDGGIIALLLASERPDLVDRVVTMGSNVSGDGYSAAGRAALAPDSPLMDFLREDWEKLTPDGADHWPVVLDKIGHLWLDPYDYRDRLASIAAPTLLMQGDDDMITPEHSLEMFRAIDNAQLAIVPGASHVMPIEKPDLINRLILDFLGGPERPEELAPMERA
jgi:pimeloyl-ACP methyl ester carboxylesterase